MKQEEFPGYKEYFIQDYGKEISENYNHSIEKGILLAQQELEEDLPFNVATIDHYLMCIEINTEVDTILIGYLWYNHNKNKISAFIYDFYIFPEYQNKGYGTATVKALEKRLSYDGVKEIKLRVAFENNRALNLYKKIGFKITGYNMIKKIYSPD